MAKQRIDHVNIVVSNLTRSVHFYVEVLGFEETRRAHLSGAWLDAVTGLAGVEAEVAYVQPPGGGPRIELIQYFAPSGITLPETALPNTVGLRHIAFFVEDIDAVCARLHDAGIETISRPMAVPEQVVTHDAGRKRLCYFRDPDGVLLELAAYS